jgi:hypothetical protein
VEIFIFVANKKVIKMKKIHVLLLAGLIVFSGKIALAGSPLIQTSFYSAYYMNEKVQLAEQLEFLDGALAAYIADKSVVIDQKLAVINALQWNEKGKNNVETFKMFLGRKYGKGFDNLTKDDLTGDEALCLGYMISLDRQKKLSDALPYLEMAKTKNPRSYSAQLFYTLAIAQDFINKSNACDAWTVCDIARNNVALVQDLNPEANSLIFTAVDAYKGECK